MEDVSFTTSLPCAALAVLARQSCFSHTRTALARSRVGLARSRVDLARSRVDLARTGLKKQNRVEKTV